MIPRIEQIKTKLSFPELSGNIYCVGRNYANHAKELGNSVPKEPLFFLKSAASLKMMDEKNRFIFQDSIHYEAELVLVVGKNIDVGTKLTDESFISGYTLGLDLTRRSVQSDLKSKGHPWTRSKNFSGSAIIGTYRVRTHKISDLEFEFLLNGKVKQQAKCSDMIFSPVEVANSLLELHSLSAGDLIFTGTPEGVGIIKPGDKYELRSSQMSLDLSSEL